VSAASEVPVTSVVIDRLVEDVAVLHVGPDAIELVVPRGLLPEGAREGDWFTVDLVPDTARTAAFHEEMRRRVERIRREQSGRRFS
jgi:hypothetical protein